jgi:hypothetical protein
MVLEFSVTTELLAGMSRPGPHTTIVRPRHGGCTRISACRQVVRHSRCEKLSTFSRQVARSWGAESGICDHYRAKGEICGRSSIPSV